MDYTTIYLSGVIALATAFAIRVPHENLRTVMVLALVWPLSLAAILFFILLNATGYDLDAAKGTKMFGFRRPTNTLIKGFAITIFYGEIQVWKKK